MLEGATSPLPMHGALPCETALKRVLRDYANGWMRAEAGVRTDRDTEFLHDYRIGLRRTRTLINRFKTELPEFAAHATDFAWLSAATGPVRDLDVFILGLPPLRDRLTPAAAEGLAALQAHLERQRASAFAALIAALDSERYQTLCERWFAFVERDEVSSPQAVARRPIAEAAANQILRTYERARRSGKRAAADAGSPELHELRKTCKKLRYLLEAFRPLYEAGPIDDLLRRLRRLQGVLGTLQDHSVHIAALSALGALGERPPPELDAPDVWMAIGELRGVLERSRRRALRNLQPAFDALARKRTRRLVAATFPAAPAPA